MDDGYPKQINGKARPLTGVERLERALAWMRHQFVIIRQQAAVAVQTGDATLERANEVVDTANDVAAALEAVRDGRLVVWPDLTLVELGADDISITDIDVDPNGPLGAAIRRNLESAARHWDTFARTAYTGDHFVAALEVSQAIRKFLEATSVLEVRDGEMGGQSDKLPQ